MTALAPLPGDPHMPAALIMEALTGKGYGRDEPYSADEQEQVRQDVAALARQILTSALPTESRKVAVITFGAPGAGKTTLLNTLRKSSTDFSFPYVCPDDVVLKALRCYQARIPNLTEAYNYARPASNGGAHYILAHLIDKGSPFCFGTTGSSPHTKGFFEYLKRKGYEICVLHVSAPNKVRWESIQARDQEFVQTTEADVHQKGDDVPQRLKDTLPIADTVHFYFRGAAQEGAVFAGSWEPSRGTLKVHNLEALTNVTAVHDAVAGRLGGVPRFEEIVKNEDPQS